MSMGPAKPKLFWELTKPRISLLCVIMFWGGFFFAAYLPGPGGETLSSWSGWKLIAGSLGTWLSVASANTLNMVLERKTDAFMTRTKGRPLPLGLISTRSALGFGVVLGVLSTVLLRQVNVLTCVLGLAALLSYVFVYTPLKRVTPHALIIGAVPGAMPPLMGFTSQSGSLEWAGLVLFGILLLWQVPHFIAIAIVHKEDYRRAGIKVLPVVVGERRAIIEALVYSVLLLAVSLALVPLAGVGVLYALTATGLGLWLIVLCSRGLQEMSYGLARRVFFASLIYLPVLTLVLVAEVFVRSTGLLPS